MKKSKRGSLGKKHRPSRFDALKVEQLVNLNFKPVSVCLTDTKYCK